MTMMTLTANYKKLRCQSMTSNISTSPFYPVAPPAPKADNRGTECILYNPDTPLREIPTKISPKKPNNTLVNPRADDDDDPLSPNSPRHSLTLADSQGNSPYTLPCAYDDAFDYTKRLADITDKIERMKQHWPLPVENCSFNSGFTQLVPYLGGPRLINNWNLALNCTSLVRAFFIEFNGIVLTKNKAILRLPETFSQRRFFP